MSTGYPGLGGYVGQPEERWPVLGHRQIAVLADIAAGRVAVIWQAGEGEFPRLGLKPWFALTTGVRGSMLHRLWLYGLIRLDRGAGVYTLDGNSGHIVGRARLTPTGQRVLAANTTTEATA
jgi:hypothetical protein